ncbi:mannose-1-phosphate guanylyltransferase [Aquisalinus flavus]|nr:sugar phosphate nucleotidyltransferase [Aquisalinus flavus]
MAGGSGTRLWPLSRPDRPKQFHKILSHRTLFQETVLRAQYSDDQITFGPPIIIGAMTFGDLIAKQLEEIGVTPQAIILEPFGRNTAAVAGIASLVAKQNSEGDVLGVLMPSDQHIDDPASFYAAIAKSAANSHHACITTFGIAADKPKTGYGYIRRGEEMDSGYYRIEAFVEKPDYATAQAYVADGGYMWNAGIFMFAPDLMLAELERFEPEILRHSALALEHCEKEGVVYTLSPEHFFPCPDQSIDYAVMEKTKCAAVCGPVRCGWSDIGSWDEISTNSPDDEVGNVIAIETTNCYLRGDDSVKVAAYGVSDLIIVAHEGSVLILPKGKSQNVKKIVQKMKENDDQ